MTGPLRIQITNRNFDEPVGFRRVRAIDVARFDKRAIIGPSIQDIEDKRKIPVLDSGEIILNEKGDLAFKATQIRRRTIEWRQFQDDPRNIMYQAREERAEIESPQEEPQPDTTGSEVKETQEMLSEEKTRKTPDELRTQENDGPMLAESIKPKTGQALMTCKEEIVSSSDDETNRTQANHVQKSTDEAIEKTGPTSPVLDPFSPEVTETENLKQDTL